MSMALMNVFDVIVVYKIWEFVPLDDITIRVAHMNHAMSLQEDEYIFTVPVGTTLGEIEQRLLDTKFNEFGWLHDELILWVKTHQHIEFDDLDNCEDGTTLCLKLFNRHYFREESDEEVSEEEEEDEESEDSD